MSATASPLVCISKLRKSYVLGDRTVDVLNDVNLELLKGDMVSVMGASGVGKSTFLQILGTLDVPTSGSIQFHGRELTAMSGPELAQFRNQHIGFVFQFHHLLPDFTALENVMMPALIAGRTGRAMQQNAKDMLGRVGLAKRTAHRPSELSGGEQQRVALARALVLGPTLVLADEPTGNLDRHTGEKVHELFVEINREMGTTLLIVTHNPELARMMPRQLSMLDRGQLVDASTAAPEASHAQPQVSVP